MIGYVIYPSDSRVRREAEALAKELECDVIILALKEEASPKRYTMDGVVVKEVDLEKYRGKSRIKYVGSYVRYLWLSLLECSKMFFLRQIDIVHVHNMPNFLVFSAVLPRIFGKKIILDIHDSVPETFAAKFYGCSQILFKLFCLEERISCALAHRIVCVNHVQRDILVERGIASKKILVCMNVPDHRIFSSRNMKSGEANENNGFTMAYHGTVTKRLGIDIAIHAVSRLANKIPNLEFHIWGNGDFLEGCVRTSKSLGVANRVYFNGTIPVHALPKALESIDLGVVANRKNIATEVMLPVKMLEYIALGIPVVVPRLKGIEYYFSDRMVCYFEPENVDSMASAILKLYKDKSIRKMQAEKAKTFLDQYGWKKHQMELINFYREI